MTRADRNRNPIACTTDIAKQAGLVLGTDYEIGDKFPDPSNLSTAKFIGDPVLTSVRVIDSVGYVTKLGLARWTYINIPRSLWSTLSQAQKELVVKFHYQNEGGTEMKLLFT